MADLLLLFSVLLVDFLVLTTVSNPMTFSDLLDFTIYDLLLDKLDSNLATISDLFLLSSILQVTVFDLIPLPILLPLVDDDLLISKFDSERCDSEDDLVTDLTDDVLTSATFSGDTLLFLVDVLILLFNKSDFELVLIAANLVS